MTEAFFFATSVHRLRDRARLAGFVLLGLALLPVEVVAGHPQFVWQILPGLPPAAALAALAPALGGAGLLLARRFCRRGLTLGSVILTLLAVVAVVMHYGGSAAAWEALSLPPSVTERPVPAVLSLGACSAGMHLAFKPELRRASRVLLGAGLALAVVYYLLPVRGEAPGVAIASMLAHMGELPHWRLQLGFAVLAVILLWPALMALLAQRYQRVVPEHDVPVAALFTLYGLPVLLGMLIYRAFPLAGAGWTVVLAAGYVLLLAALLALLSSTLEVVVEGALSSEAAAAELELPPGMPPRRLGTVCFAVLAVAWGGVAWLAAPPVKGVDWTLSEPTPEGERLFGELLPAWADARLAWDRRVRTESGALDLVTVTKAGAEAVRAARALAPGLGDAVEALVRGARSLDLAGRHWYGLIGDLNEAARVAGLPFYVDPTVYEFATQDGVRRHFRMRSYRVHEVHTREVDGRRYAALHVGRLGEAHRSDARLGFSRDLQPFALVARDEIETWTERLKAGRCGVSEDFEGSLERCEALLKRLAGDDPPALAAALVRMTERHEIQHQIDGPELPMPTVVTRIAGRYGDETRQRISRELSAYLMEITTEEAPPQLALVHLYPFALASPSAEHFVALLIFEGLTDRAIFDPQNDELNETALDAAFDTLASLPEETLRERALGLWRRWY